MRTWPIGPWLRPLISSTRVRMAARSCSRRPSASWECWRPPKAGVAGPATLAAVRQSAGQKESANILRLEITGVLVEVFLLHGPLAEEAASSRRLSVDVAQSGPDARRQSIALNSAKRSTSSTQVVDLGASLFSIVAILSLGLPKASSTSFFSVGWPSAKWAAG